MVDDAAYGLTAEALAYARQRYETTDQPVRTIADDVGTSPAKLYKIAKAEGWQLRKDRPPRGLSEALKLDLEATDAENKPSESSRAKHGSAGPDTSDADSVAARLEAQVEKQLRKVESLRGEPPRGKRSIEAERVARTLATLTETLFKVRRLRQPGNISGSNDDDLPADPDGFRLALAHRIEAFVRSRTDGSVSERGKLEDGEPAAS
ncbi:MAG: hypothetical protein QOH32_2423 [Bradyrhizobium sp.]|nr:hypothetical protein [Bradyrhizobium sp.]